MSTPTTAMSPLAAMSALNDVVALIGRGHRFLVSAHRSPDGDALGSMLATAHALRALGKEVVLYDRDKEDREAISNEIATRRGATLVRPYDDPFVIAGQGTAGREIAEDMTALGLTPDIVVAPASGGGRIAGVATAIKARFPQASLIVAEPEGYDDHGLSLRAGHREAKQRASLNLRHTGRKAPNRHIDAAGHDFGNGRGHAAKRHVQCLHARQIQQQFHGEMR